MPVQLSHDLCGISKLLDQCQAKVVCWCGLTLFDVQYANAFSNCLPNHKTSRDAMQYQIGVTLSTRHWPKVKMIRNVWDRSAQVMWHQRLVAQPHDHLLIEWKHENMQTASYGAHQHQWQMTGNYYSGCPQGTNPQMQPNKQSIPMTGSYHAIFTHKVPMTEGTHLQL